MSTGGSSTTAPAETWTENPNLGDFNPGTASGTKIFNSKIKSVDTKDRLSLSKSDAPKFKTLLMAKSAQFGPIITAIPSSFANDGTVLQTSNLITSYSNLSLEEMQRNAHSYFSTAVDRADPIPTAPFIARELKPATVDDDKKAFYKRVNSQVVAEWLHNTLNDEGYSDILRQQELFSFVDSATGIVKFDGPTMLKIVLDTIDPSVVVGVEVHRKRLEDIRLHEFGNDVTKMCSEIERVYQAIVDLGGTCESIRRYLITALSSGPNATFNNFIDRINDDIESGRGENKNANWRDIVLQARKKYINMEATKKWNHVDPRDAKLLALTTELEKIKKSHGGNGGGGASNGSGGGNGSGNGGGNRNKQDMLTDTVAKWRATKGEESVQRDGKTWYWCKHHKHPDGLWDGLYVTHTQATHDGWIKNREGSAKSSDTKASAAGDSDKEKASSSTSKLRLGERLKQVLCTKLMLSDEDANKVVAEIGSEN